MSYPKDRSACKLLAEKLVAFLREQIDATHTQAKWSQRNFDVLNAFAKNNGWKSFSSPKVGGKKENLWDWTAFDPDEGLVVACESEWLQNSGQLSDDFTKLVFAQCPIKLFICWVSDKDAAQDVVERLKRKLSEDYFRYQAGSVYLLYCVHAKSVKDENRDCVFAYHAPGEWVVTHQALTFEPWPARSHER